MLFATIISLLALCFVGKAEVRDLSAMSIEKAEVRKCALHFNVQQNPVQMRFFNRNSWLAGN